MRLLLALGAALAISACGGSSGGTAAGTPKTQDSAAAVMDADAVAAKLQAAGVPIVKTFTVTAANDPNHLLGRPNGYTSKVVVTDSRVPESDRGDVGGVDQGASIEVFADASTAKSRADYIGAIRAKSPALANEYDFVHGAVLIRVTGILTPEQAKDYDKAV